MSTETQTYAFEQIRIEVWRFMVNTGANGNKKIRLSAFDEDIRIKRGPKIYFVAASLEIVLQLNPGI